MLVVTHGEVDHRERMRMLAIAEIEMTAGGNLRMISEVDRRRGEFTETQLDGMRRDINRMQHAVCRNQVILEARGVEAPPRKHLFRQGQHAADGCFVTYDRQRPQLFLYAGFGTDFGDISGDEVVKHLRDIGDDVDIDLRFNSPGGIVREVDIICEALGKRRGQTRGIVDGVAASGASQILMHCNPIGIRRGARVLIHFARVTRGLHGPQTAKDLERTLDSLRAIDRDLASCYAPRWRGTAKELVAAMDDEKDFVDEEAVAWGLADYVTESTSIATEADIEAAWAKQGTNPANVRDRRAFAKYRTVFEQFQVAARYMPHDGESLMDSVRRSDRERKLKLSSRARSASPGGRPGPVSQLPDRATAFWIREVR